MRTILVSTLIVFAGLGVSAQVISSPNPIANLKMTSKAFEQIDKTLGANRWVPNSRCHLKVDKRFLNLNFIKGTYKGDALFLEFETEHLGPRKMWATISMASTYGSKFVNDAEFGPVEEVRVEAGDTEGTWVQYRTDGTYITQFEIGNVRGIGSLCSQVALQLHGLFLRGLFLSELSPNIRTLL